MANKTLILSTTKKISTDGRFNPSNPEIEQIEDKDIYRLTDELIFVRDLIITEKGQKTADEINEEIIQFTVDVFEYLEEQKQAKDIEQIIYFIHSKELNYSAKNYKTLSSEITQVEHLLIELNNSYPEPLKKIVAFKHDENYWSDFLEINKLNKKKDSLSWTENIQLYFDEKEEQDEAHSTVVELESDIKNLIDNTSESYEYKLRICKDGILGEQNKDISDTVHFQIINTSTSTFQEFKKLNNLSQAINIKADRFIPTIIIGEYDIMCDTSNVTDEKRSILSKLELDRRYRFFDSSIWVRYVSKEKNELGEPLKKQLQRVIEEIKTHLKSRLYESNVAKEHIEYQLRLFKDSFLKSMGGSHAESITPFIFHSETYMENKANILLENFKIHQICWNLLLVDDFARSPLTIGNIEFHTDKTNIKKCEIIYQLLNKNSVNPIFSLSTATSIKEAINKLENEKSLTNNSIQYDAILLDYLFSKGRSSEEVKYGTELLDVIDKNSKLKKAKSFNYKFWIYPVSVFSDALHSSLREQGVQHLEKHWVLARGADPINTPHLFCHDFFDFISIQFNGVIYRTKDIIELLLSDTISPSEKEPIDARYWARRFYHSLWTKFGKSESLIYNSSFARTAAAYKERQALSKSFEIFRQLEMILHNLAFASIFDFEGTEFTYLQLYESLLEECDRLVQDGQLTRQDRIDLEIQLKRLGEGIYGIHN